MRRLVINADDLGLSEGVNRGILEAHEAGAVSSASMLVNLPAWGDAIARVRGPGRRMGVGLHLNLVLGRPLEPVRTLVDPLTGKFLSLGELAWRAVAGRIDESEVVAECAAQIARLEAAGAPITHLDSHRHAHLLPGLWRPIISTAFRAGIRVVRVPVESPWINPMRLGASLKRAALAACWRMVLKNVPAVEVRSPDFFVGPSLQGGHFFGPRLLRALEGLRPGTTEIMVHPGRVDSGLPAEETYTWQRECELEVLLSASVRARLGRGDIELTHFGAV